MSNRLDDGFSSVITLANAPAIKLYEKTLTPPGITGGGPIETTTMRNTTWRTKAPKSLMTLDAVQTKCAYATEVYNDVMEQLQQNQLITISFSDGTAIRFWGWLESFVPEALAEGTQPEATVMIQPSLRNASGVETAPDYNDVDSENP